MNTKVKQETALSEIPAIIRQATSELLRLRAENERLRKACEEVELRTTQARMAITIGKQTGKADFLRNELERIGNFARLQHSMDDGTPMPESEVA